MEILKNKNMNYIIETDDRVKIIIPNQDPMIIEISDDICLDMYHERILIRSNDVTLFAASLHNFTYINKKYFK